jgi:hypothetical protein
MGIYNWLLKNGPGSPGSTAKAYIKAYKKMGVTNHDENWVGIFHELFRQRYLTNQITGFSGGSLLNKVEVNEIVEFSEGDLGLFVFYMMLLETSTFRNSISSTFNEVTSVIHEVVKEEAPSTVKFNLANFRVKASSL